MNKTLTEKYRPQIFGEIVGNQEIIQQLQNLAKRNIGEVPVILLLGQAGVGKTTAVRCFAKERGAWLKENNQQSLLDLDTDLTEFNASDYRGIDFVREELERCTKTKIESIIYLNESDNMTADAKDALRSILEKKGNAIFILDGNDASGFTEPMKSRCSIFLFQPLSQTDILNRLRHILKAEKVHTQGEKIIEELAKQAKGDLRQAINSLEPLIQHNQIMFERKNVDLSSPTEKEDASITKAVTEIITTSFSCKEEIVQAHLQKVLDAPNQLEALMPHLDNIIAGETQTKKVVTVLLSSAKSPNPKDKQILFFKANSGAGKSEVMNKLSPGYETVSVGRLTPHALDRMDFEKANLLVLKELGSVDSEKQGVSTIKFLSSEDGGYTMLSATSGGTREFKIPAITLMSGTVRNDIDEQLERRVWYISVDESIEQTERIAEFNAKSNRQNIEKSLGYRIATDLEVSSEVYKRFIEQFSPVEVLIPFLKTLEDVLPKESLRVRGDFKKVEVAVKLYANFNVKRLLTVKGFKVCSPEVAVEALRLIAPFLSAMLAKSDGRTIPLLNALKNFGRCNRGYKIDKQIRERLADELHRDEKTIRDLLNMLAKARYVSSDQKKPVTFELLYDVDEILRKHRGISEKLDSADDLMAKMTKEAQETLGLPSEIPKLKAPQPLLALPPPPPINEISEPQTTTEKAETVLSKPDSQPIANSPMSLPEPILFFDLQEKPKAIELPKDVLDADQKEMQQG